jgi:1-acyl-sn-glycerol-3-phosphate acyltransferase
MTEVSPSITYPRLRFSRGILRGLIHLAFNAIANIHVEGEENLPENGPLLIVANHFSFLDPVAMIHITRWPLEFLAGANTPNAPATVSWLRKAWGVFPVYRGSVSRSALRSAESVLNQGGVVGIFPEAGNWATVLRPARPGTAYLAARTGVPIVPMGFSGLLDVFSKLSSGRRADIHLRIGPPFGPFRVTGRGRERRKQLDEIGHRIMEHIAELLPDRERGHYADDPAIRAAAQGTEIYPWDDHPDI